MIFQLCWGGFLEKKTGYESPVLQNSTQELANGIVTMISIYTKGFREVNLKLLSQYAS